MCLALTSKPYWSNKQVVPLLGFCSDTPCPQGNLVICGDRTFFPTPFWVRNRARNLTGKILLHFCNTLWPKMRPLNASFLSGLGMYSARLPCSSESANFLKKKIAKFCQIWPFSSILGSISFTHIRISLYWYMETSGHMAASFWNHNLQRDYDLPKLP